MGGRKEQYELHRRNRISVVSDRRVDKNAAGESVRMGAVHHHGHGCGLRGDLAYDMGGHAMIRVGEVIESQMKNHYTPYQPTHRRQTKTGANVEIQFGAILNPKLKKELRNEKTA